MNVSMFSLNFFGPGLPKTHIMDHRWTFLADTNTKQIASKIIFIKLKKNVVYQWRVFEDEVLTDVTFDISIISDFV